MEERNIALIGFRATGKSAVGKILAKKLDMVFIDMDQHLVSAAGHDIATWVKLAGWDSFRKAESELLSLLCARRDQVIATGGGIVLDPENRGLIRECCFTVWLRATPGTIISRMTSDPGTAVNRPALSSLPLMEEIENVLSEREPLYSEVADIEVDTEGKSVEEIGEEILARLR